MRFALSAASLLFAGLLSSAAFADEAKPVDAPPVAPAASASAAKKLPLRVVRVLTETHQALLFDKTKGTHVLVEVGQQVNGFTVDDIDDDSVTLTAIEGGAQIVLAGPDPSWRRHRDAMEPTTTKPSTTATATTAGSDAAPEDPYGDDVRTVEAPTPQGVGVSVSAGGSVRTVEAPGATTTPAFTTTVSPNATATPASTPRAATASAAPTIATPPITDTSSAAAWSGLPDVTLTPAAATTITPPPAPADAPTVLARADVSAALANFGALSSSVRGAFTPTGVRLDALSPDSILAKAGLRTGDVITAVNNQPLRSLDDAASLYARAGSMRTATIQVQRAGQPLRLTIAIQ